MWGIAPRWCGRRAVSSHLLLQLSDPHLSASSSATLKGINTAASLSAVVDHALHCGATFDAVLATGDLSQDGSAESYQRFIDLTEPLAPLCWLPGNHDKPAAMHALLPEAMQTLALGNWRVLTLDSTVANEPHGELGAARLSALAVQLAALEADADAAHLIVAVHHNPVANGAQWLNGIGLRDGAALLDQLNASAKVRALVHGHIHHPFDEQFGAVRVLGAPSTCVQFAPIATDFAIDSAQPGYRWLRLHEDGTLETGVARLPAGSFVADASIASY